MTESEVGDLAERLRRARERTAEAGLDALLITPGADLRYLTGYQATALERLTCLVVPAAGVEREPVLVVPALERAAAEASPAGGLGLELVAWGELEDPYARALEAVPPANGRAGRPERLAVDDHMVALHLLAFRDAAGPGTELSLAGSALRALRLRKTSAEVDHLREAAQAIDRVHARIAEWLRPGRTEREVGRDIADAILAEGHVRVDFTIVGSGPNAASPHHEVSDRVIEKGEPVVVDIGGTTAAGYCSDSTRTYVAGGIPPAEFVAYYQVLHEAQIAACEAVRPGVSAESIDAAARTVIDKAGFGPNFIHRTGHGIGLESHEDPYIVEGNTIPLEPGMAFSIEPGIYVAGRHGARIEDIVVVTPDGGERLNVRPRGLVVLDV